MFNGTTAAKAPGRSSKKGIGKIFNKKNLDDYLSFYALELIVSIL